MSGSDDDGNQGTFPSSPDATPEPGAHDHPAPAPAPAPAQTFRAMAPNAANSAKELKVLLDGISQVDS